MSGDEPVRYGYALAPIPLIGSHCGALPHPHCHIQGVDISALVGRFQGREAVFASSKVAQPFDTARSNPAVPKATSTLANL